MNRYLNTSHVKVKRKTTFIHIIQHFYLNTSHVKVKLLHLLNKDIEKEFKYISC